MIPTPKLRLQPDDKGTTEHHVVDDDGDVGSLADGVNKLYEGIVHEVADGEGQCLSYEGDLAKQDAMWMPEVEGKQKVHAGSGCNDRMDRGGDAHDMKG